LSDLVSHILSLDHRGKLIFLYEKYGVDFGEMIQVPFELADSFEEVFSLVAPIFGASGEFILENSGAFFVIFEQDKIFCVCFTDKVVSFVDILFKLL
jgi:hypothetical protein